LKELNMRQKRWLELIKDYDCEINYHLGRKSSTELATMSISQPQIIMELKRLKLEVVTRGSPVLLSSMVIQPKLLERFKNAQENDPESQRIRKKLEEGKAKEISSEG